MPYFVYKVYSERKLEMIEQFDGYRDARNHARELRAALPADAGYQIRVIFAKNPEEASMLLSEKREPRPLGEDA
jgi:hypothetical protein